MVKVVKGHLRRVLWSTQEKDTASGVRNCSPPVVTSISPLPNSCKRLMGYLPDEAEWSACVIATEASSGAFAAEASSSVSAVVPSSCATAAEVSPYVIAELEQEDPVDEVPSVLTIAAAGTL